MSAFLQKVKGGHDLAIRLLGMCSKEMKIGNSLAVQWLGLCALTAGAQVQSLVGELSSHKPRGAAEKKNNFHF